MSGLMADRNVFVEPDTGRLTRRLMALTSNDLSSAEIDRLAAGDLRLVQDLPVSTQQGVLALVDRKAEPFNALESMIGATLDYVPIAYLDLARSASRPVARVVDVQGNPIGTATLVSSRLILTNHHVTESEDVAHAQLVQFDYELGIDGTPEPITEFRLAPEVFFWTSPEATLDVSLIALGERVTGEEMPTTIGWCTLSGAQDKHAIGDFVTIIQHPEGAYKQIALRENRVLGRGKSGTTLFYGADTLPGSSGSPVFNDQFQLVAIHHAGAPSNDKTLDTGQPAPQASNEGMRVSAIVETLRATLDTIGSRYRDLLAEALDAPTTQTAFPTISAPLTSLTLVPATSSVLAGTPDEPAPLDSPTPAATQPTGAVDGSPSPQLVAALERNQPPDPRYNNRRGYDPKFLSTAVALPKLTQAQLDRAALPAKQTKTADGVLLRYLHFSLVVDATRRVPRFTAVNIDGSRSRGINRSTGAIEAAETWYTDPRLDPADQLDQTFYGNQQPKRIFDRGHMVRRLDPAWGAPATAVRGADDTFHFTNCCPQISKFNQSTALWAGIEDYVLTNAKAAKERITVFTGPILADDDPTYDDVRIPRAFWKLLIRFDAHKLKATAFLASQDDLLKQAIGGAEALGDFTDLGNAAVFQTTVKHLQDQTELDFGALADHDTASLEALAATRITNLDHVSW